MPKDHLVPARVTNVNGVSTTVYRRPVDARKTTEVSITAPTLAQPKDSDDLMARKVSEVRRDCARIISRLKPDEQQASAIDEVLEFAVRRDGNDGYSNLASVKEMLMIGMVSALAQVGEHKDEIPPHVDLMTFGKTKVSEKCLRLLISDEDKRQKMQDDYVRSFVRTVPSEHFEGTEKAVIAACERDQRRDIFGEVSEFERYLSNGSTLVLDSYGRNAGIIPHGVGIEDHWTVLVAVNSFLRSEGIRVEKDTPITFAAHLRAYQQFEPLEDQKLLPTQMRVKYATNRSLIAAVEAHPHDVDAIMKYRIERQTNHFGSDFLEYLNGGAMKDGML